MVLFVVFIVLDYVDVLSLEFVALNPSFVLEQGTYWTFLTSMFMHGGIFHLFVNMLSLFFVGGLLEKILGKRRYFSLYLISGLFAGLFFVLASLVFSADYISLSPVSSTPSHSHVPGLGWKAASDIIRKSNLPVYLLGGMSKEVLDKALSIGAQGVAGISRI